MCASNGQSDPFGPGADSAGQLFLDKIKTTDDKVEILNASEGLNKGWITKNKRERKNLIVF